MAAATSHRLEAPPRLDAPPPRRIRGWTVALGVLVGSALIVLARVEPSGQFYFPRCWLYQMTGLQCPGCGATRAVHALLNGELERAWRLNALVVAMVPLLAWLGLRGLCGWWTGRWWRDPVTHPASLAILGGLAMGYGLARNFPGFP